MPINNENICCPQIDPALWDDKVFEWNNKKFVKDKVFTLFFIPITFGSVMKKLDKHLRSANISIPDSLCLADHTSKWNMDIYVAVDKEVPNANNVILNGKFFCKVYEGPFKDTGKWCKDYEEKAKNKGFKIKKWFMWYTTCPKCAKKYGKNYVAIISEVI